MLAPRLNGSYYRLTIIDLKPDNTYTYSGFSTVQPGEPASFEYIGSGIYEINGGSISFFVSGRTVRGIIRGNLLITSLAANGYTYGTGRYAKVN